MKSQKEYWDRKIKDWTDASYGKKPERMSLVERVANLFRGPITKRMNIALKTVGPKVKGKVIMDMGCGLGDFCFEILKYKPKKVIGVDVSGIAVKEATKISKKKGLEDRIKFIEGEIGRMKKLPSFDVAVGLGFIDYLDKGELKNLFRLLSGRQFFFSFFEKKLSLLNLIHAFYVKWQKCPGAFKYTRKEMKEIIPASANFYFLDQEGMVFLTNLPK